MRVRVRLPATCRSTAHVRYQHLLAQDQAGHVRYWHLLTQDQAFKHLFNPKLTFYALTYLHWQSFQSERHFGHYRRSLITIQLRWEYMHLYSVDQH